MMAAMDMQLLPAASRFIGCAWAASPSQLGAIVGAGALLQALAIPLGAVAGSCGLLHLHTGRTPCVPPHRAPVTALPCWPLADHLLTTC
jgi:hypothetical protein